MELSSTELSHISHIFRTHFTYEHTEHAEMAFSNGAIFRVTDTLCGGVVGSWRAILLGRNNQETIHGVIPNKNRLVYDYSTFPVIGHMFINVKGLSKENRLCR